MTAADAWGVTDARAVAEAVVDVLEERGLVATASAPSRMLSAAQVAQLLGRRRQWVYDHAAELGAFRYGDGPKARIGFDLVAVERWKRDSQIRQPRAQTAARERGRSRPSVRLIPYDGAGARP